MKLNDAQLRKKIGACLQSDAFQKKLNKSRVLPPANTVYWTMSDIEYRIHDLKTILLSDAQVLTERHGAAREGLGIDKEGTSRLGGASPEGLLDHKITNIQYYPGDKKYIISCQVRLYFNDRWVSSPSLFGDGGVDNLLRLLTNGWDSRKDLASYPLKGGRYWSSSTGTWYPGASLYTNTSRSKDGIPGVHALLHREPNFRLFDSINRYNKKYEREKIFAQLDSSYINVHGIDVSHFVKSVRAWGGKHQDYYEVRIQGIGNISFGRR